MLEVVWYGISGRLDAVFCCGHGRSGRGSGVAARGYGEGCLDRRERHGLVCLVALRHALPDSHADVEQVSLHAARYTGSERVPLLELPLGEGLLLSGNRARPRQIVVAAVAAVGLVVSEEAGDGRLELPLGAVLVSVVKWMCVYVSATHYRERGQEMGDETKFEG